MHRPPWMVPAAVIATVTLAAAPVFAAGFADSLPGDTISYVSDPSLGSLPLQASFGLGGPTLLFSNAPEEVPGQGILYQDHVSGHFRVFFDHVDQSDLPLVFTIVVTNDGTAPVDVRPLRVGYAGPGMDYFQTGQDAQRAWMSGSGGDALTLDPGQSAFLVPGLNTLAASAGQDVTGIVDATASDSLLVSVVAESQATTDLSGLSVLPATPTSAGFIGRGTFPHANLTVSAAADGGYQHLDVASPEQYVTGYSAVDHQPAEDYGNYGVLYDVRLSLFPTAAERLALVFDPLGGPFAGSALIGQGFDQSTPVDLPRGGTFAPSPLAGMLVTQLNLEANNSELTRFQWMPPAGSNLPATLILTPY